MTTESQIALQRAEQIEALEERVRELVQVCTEAQEEFRRLALNDWFTAEQKREIGVWVYRLDRVINKY